MTQIVLAAPTTGAIAAGTNAINYGQDFKDVEVVGIHAAQKEVPFPDVLSLFRDVHRRAQHILRDHQKADVAVVFTNEMVSFRDTLSTRVTFSVGTILTCFRKGGGVTLHTQSTWVPDSFHKYVNKMGDMFEGEMQAYFEKPPTKYAMKSAQAIVGNIRAVVEVPIIEKYDTVH